MTLKLPITIPRLVRSNHLALVLHDPANLRVTHTLSAPNGMVKSFNWATGFRRQRNETAIPI